MERLPVKSPRGFTLIELIVVVAIIASLMAILVPVFATVRGSAQRAACLSNERQIGLGIVQYVADNDGLMPYAIYAGSCSQVMVGQDIDGAADPACHNPLPSIYGGPQAIGVAWPYLIAPYIQSMSSINGGRRFINQSVFLCPDAPSSYSGYSPETDYFVNTAQARYQHDSSGLVSLMPVNDSSYCPKVETPILLDNVTRQSQIVLLTELWRTGNHPSAVIAPHLPEIFYYWWNYSGPSSTGLPVGAFERHQTGANCLMVDGHAKWVREADLLTDQNDMWGFSSF